MHADGPALMLQFTISPAKQLYILSSTTHALEALTAARDVDAGVFSVVLEPHEASKLFISQPSPMYPCVNV